MRLYCYKLLNNDVIVDVEHLLASDSKECHKILDNYIENMEKCYPNYANSYSFSEVIVGNLNISDLLHFENINKGVIVIEK